MAETEAVLLDRFARTGDAEAFAEITRRHAGLVYGAALRILADMDRAADVAQETFLQLAKDAHKISGSLSGWLHRVATHRAIDQVRRDASRRRREDEYAANQVRQATEWKDLSRYVDQGLDELDAEMREILVAHYLEGRTTRQIGQAREISQATVSRRLDAGVMRLRSILRRRGVFVSAGLLGTMLTENAVQAAPAGVMTELGKMALVGSAGAAATAGASASAAQAVGGGVIAGVKAKVVAAAVVAVVGVGSVVTYQQATNSSPEPAPQTSPADNSTSGPARRAVTTTTPPSRVSTQAAGPSQAAEEWTELIGSGEGRADDSQAADDLRPWWEVAGSDQSASTNDGYSAYAGGPAGGMMGGMGMGATAPPQENAFAEESEPGSDGGGYYHFRHRKPEDANDSNGDDR
jgi:RNA polymerase sigma factor (sigma-70 family)